MDGSRPAKVGIVVSVVVLAVGAFVARSFKSGPGPEDAKPAPAADAQAPAGEVTKTLPRLVDLGAGKCIPCKAMAPILADLKREFAGQLIVEFIDVWENPGAGKAYGVKLIPTQIFYDASGKEILRHEGFFSREDILAVFRDNGVDLGSKGVSPPEIVREDPVAADTRPKDSVCFLCERSIDAKTKVTVNSPASGVTGLCSPHCYFVLESCLVDKESAAKVEVTDYVVGGKLLLQEAVLLCGADERGRPTIKAFVSREAARSEMRSSGGNVLMLDAVREQEYAVRCGFCDRVMYLQDNGSKVRVSGGTQTFGCCPHCALGVAARLGRDIAIEYHDPVDGTPIRIETLDGRVKSLAPPTAVAWFGQRKKQDGTFKSAGCFHQWNFVGVDNLKKWIEEHPSETGRMITIHAALAAKMKLSPEQISKACKISECR